MTPPRIKARHYYPNRRTFLGSVAAAGVVSAWPAHSQAQAQFTRKSLQGGNFTSDLQTYSEAVKAMLNLPPEDPRNWYRHALTHMMDCPHGNWWFLVWHRGYLAHLENICRELTGNANFALPFWDWTVETKVPDAFWQGVLNPAAPEYETSVNTFRSKFRAPMEAYWNGLSSEQLAQQMARGSMLPPFLAYSNFNEFWNSAEFHFFGSGQSRTLTQGAPDLNTSAQNAVSTSTISDALSPTVFVSDTGAAGFETSLTANHHGGGDQSIIESQPHNLVHGSIGGLMGRWLSPTDPIFFMHHCNIDRLWDVWSRKQIANGRPDGVPVVLEEDYKTEPFLFFHDGNGNPATMTTAGEYTDVATFEYDYESGTGEDEVTPILALSAPVAGSLTVADASFDIADPATSSLALSEELAARIGTDDDRFFATISIEPPEDVRGLEFLVFIGREGEDIDTSTSGENFAGAVSFFGDVSHGMGLASFNIGITDVMRRLSSGGDLSPGDELQVKVVPQGREGSLALSGNAEGSLVSASIGTI